MFHCFNHPFDNAKWPQRSSCQARGRAEPGRRAVAEAYQALTKTGDLTLDLRMGEQKYGKYSKIYYVLMGNAIESIFEYIHIYI